MGYVPVRQQRDRSHIESRESSAWYYAKRSRPVEIRTLGGFEKISAMFLTDDSRRMSLAEVKRKTRSKSSVGSLSVSGGEIETDMS